MRVRKRVLTNIQTLYYLINIYMSNLKTKKYFKLLKNREKIMKRIKKTQKIMKGGMNVRGRKPAWIPLGSQQSALVPFVSNRALSHSGSKGAPKGFGTPDPVELVFESQSSNPLVQRGVSASRRAFRRERTEQPGNGSGQLARRVRTEQPGNGSGQLARRVRTKSPRHSAASADNYSGFGQPGLRENNEAREDCTPRQVGVNTVYIHRCHLNKILDEIKGVKQFISNPAEETKGPDEEEEEEEEEEGEEEEEEEGEEEAQTTATPLNVIALENDDLKTLRDSYFLGYNTSEVRSFFADFLNYYGPRNCITLIMTGTLPANLRQVGRIIETISISEYRERATELCVALTLIIDLNARVKRAPNNMFSHQELVQLQQEAVAKVSLMSHLQISNFITDIAALSGPGFPRFIQMYVELRRRLTGRIQDITKLSDDARYIESLGGDFSEIRMGNFMIKQAEYILQRMNQINRSYPRLKFFNLMYILDNGIFAHFEVTQLETVYMILQVLQEIESIILKFSVVDDDGQFITLVRMYLTYLIDMLLKRARIPEILRNQADIALITPGVQNGFSYIGNLMFNSVRDIFRGDNVNIQPLMNAVVKISKEYFLYSHTGQGIVSDYYIIVIGTINGLVAGEANIAESVEQDARILDELGQSDEAAAIRTAWQSGFAAAVLRIKHLMAAAAAAAAAPNPGSSASSGGGKPAARGSGAEAEGSGAEAEGSGAEAEGSGAAKMKT
jgi:hypothetical protein